MKILNMKINENIQWYNENIFSAILSTLNIYKHINYRILSKILFGIENNGYKF